MKFDVIIIGTGAAGINTALSISKNKKILLVSKGRIWDSNSFYAQGGIAASLDKDDENLHFEDSLAAGSFTNNKKALEILVKNSNECIQNLIKNGMEFDCDNDAKIIYTKEGAHSKARILHSGGDATGRNLHLFLARQLIKFSNIYVMVNSVVCDLLFKKDKCVGINVFNGKNFQNLYANSVIIASGGVGALYALHTNSLCVTGDMHAIVLKHGLKLIDMHLLQFHPTALMNDGKKRKFLLSEALRGEGATVVDEDLKRFLFDSDKRGELASRDIVSRAIHNHQISGHKVFLDISKWKKSEFKNRFPTIAQELENSANFGDLIQISPAFHYTMGGILCDEFGRVKGTKDLYVVGEAAGSGVQGSNRLASNSLLEAMVFSQIVANEINSSDSKLDSKLDIKVQEFELSKDGDATKNEKIGTILTKYAGIVRTKNGLEFAFNELESLRVGVGYFTKLHIDVAQNIVTSALFNDSIGSHFIVQD